MLEIENENALESATSQEITLRDVFAILFRRRRVIIGALLLGIAVAALLMMRPRKYTANGTIRVQPGTSSMYRTSPAALLSGEETDKIASETAIVQSRTLYLDVAKELNLVNDPAFWGKSHLKPQSLDDPKTRETVIRMMRNQIAVGHNPKDELINISCTTSSPALSSKVVNTLINDYISNLFRMRYGSTKRVSGWLIGQLDDLKQQIESDQAEIIKLQKKLGVIGLNDQNSEYLQTQALTSMTKASSEATIERILAEAKLRNLQQSDPNLMEGEVNLLQGTGPGGQNSLLQNLRNAQAQAASSYARLVTQFGPNYPEVKQQKAQLDEITNEVKTEQQRILNQAKVSYDAAKANESLNHDVLRQKTGEAFNSGGDMAKYVLLMHDYQSHRNLYEELVQRLREAGITSGLEAGEIDIVDLADLPVLPNPPGRLLLLAGGLMIGLILGCFAALAVDALETRIISVEQAERATGLPLLAMIPHVAKLESQKAAQKSLVAAAPSSQYGEALQSLRTSILLAKAGASSRVLVVSSALPAEGKSTTARNLAMAFARHNIRVLLIDGDLRRGVQAVLLGLNPGRGVTNVVTGQLSIEDVIQPVPEAENLYLMATGPRPPDPAVLTSSQQMKDLIELCKSKFDLVVIDSAPILGISDTIHLGRSADAVALVVREGVSNRRAVRDAVTRLRNARLQTIGFALNDVDYRAHSYGYGYGYGKSYEGYFKEAAGEKR